jgi:hypothetical protein
MFTIETVFHAITITLAFVSGDESFNGVLVPMSDV